MHSAPGNQTPDMPNPMPPSSPGPDLIPEIKEPPSPDLPGERPVPNPDEKRDPPERT
jgi:hypothetical protein